MYLPTALFVALKRLFHFQQTQFTQVFPLKPEPFCKLSAGLGCTNKSAISLPFFCSLNLVCPYLRLFFYFNLSGRSGRNCLLFPPVLLNYNWSPDTRFSRETTPLISWPNGERYSFFLQSLIVSLLLSLISTFLFSRTGGVLSHLNSLTRRFTRFLLKNIPSSRWL